MEKKLQQLYMRLCACAVFRGVIEKPVFSAFKEYCLSEGDITEKVDAYGRFVAEVYRFGGSLTELVKELVLADENVYVKSYAGGAPILDCVANAAEEELKLFSKFGALTPSDFAEDLGINEKEIPIFSSFNAYLPHIYKERL